MKTSRWVGAALLLALIGAGGWWFFVRVPEPQLTFRTGKIERGPLQAAVSATGTVTPVRQVQISSQVSGQIKELFVDFNTEVRSGQLIAQLDPETFEYRVRQSTADVEAARASVLTAQANVQSALAQVTRAQGDLGEAQRDEKRKQDLVAQNFISPAELDTRPVEAARRWPSALKVAQAQVDVAQAQAQNAQAIVRAARGAVAAGAGRPGAHADPLAGGRHRHQAQRRGRPDRGRQPAGTGAVRHRAQPVGHAGRGGHRRGRHLARARRPEGQLQHRCLSRPQLRGRGAPGAQGRGVGAERGVLHRGGGLLPTPAR